MVKHTYIHIPFCQSICSYCDFCKMFYKSDLVDKYLLALKREIEESYQGEIEETIYIGGGTPSCLTIGQLETLLDILKVIKRNAKTEFTIECNIEDITVDKLNLFLKYGINRLSIGVQTLNDKYLSFLNRKQTKEEVISKIELAKEVGFTNINIDLMYALENETVKEVENDIAEFLKLNIPHISVYSLILEDHTKLKIEGFKEIDPDVDAKMYETIETVLEESGYKHYEVSNYAIPGYESLHNLAYWNNNLYYGFGLGASGYIDNIRYTNTRNINTYLVETKRVEEVVIDLESAMSEEMILGLRKLEGVNKQLFKAKFGKDIKEQYDIIDLLDKHLLEENEEYIYIPRSKIYVSNSILINFL